MKQIRDTNIIHTPEVAIDPRLFVPDGVIDIGVKSTEIDPDNPTANPADDEEEFVDVTNPTTGTGDGGDVNYTPPSNNDIPAESGEENVLPTPQSITIVSQTIRMSPDGGSLVDVVIEIEDLPGVTDFDVRVTK